MTPDELFRMLSLDSLNFSSFQAHITQGGSLRDIECNAHVEFQLTPSTVDGANPPQFALHIRLTCNGTPVRDPSKTRLFELEIKSLAIYRQTGADSVSINDFSANHTVFARQVFPVLAMRAQALLEQLGLHSIRLPLDLPHEVNAGQNSAPLVLN